MADDLRDFLPDVEGQARLAKVRGDGEVRREIRRALRTGQHLVRSQNDVLSGEAAVVLRRHHLHLRPQAVLIQVQGNLTAPNAAVDPIAGVVPGIGKAPGGVGGSLHLPQAVHGVPRLVFQVLEELDVIRVHLIQGVLQADVHGDGGGDRHQHHGGEDADAGQAHGVLLHPVEKAGNGGEVPGLVVKFRVGPEAL